MRSQIITNQRLRGRAYAGTYVVVLAWDFLDPENENFDDLLGFAIERTEKDNGLPVEQYWMKGIKRFKDKDKGLAPGTPISTAEHPVQSFQWCDYTAKHGREYNFRIVPVYGKPKLLKLAEDDALNISIWTEEVVGRPATANERSISHDVYFNRGVIGSQAYAREFGNKEPERDKP